jgi:sugar lactone lactonase YvrE
VPRPAYNRVKGGMLLARAVRMIPRCKRTVSALCSLLAVSACARADAARVGARHVETLDGFSFPESVRYDEQQDVFFVSNIDGYGSEKDGRGYISRVRADSLAGIDVFVASGVNGALLDAPKGLALQGDTLWVADIEVIRGFHRVNGTPLRTIDLQRYAPLMLNDLTVGADGALYVTDTGIIMSRVGVKFQGPSRIFRLAGDSVQVIQDHDAIPFANGIVWDSAGSRLVVVSFGPFSSSVYSLKDSAKPEVLAQGSGRFDGVELLTGGRILYTAWSDSSVHMLSGGADTRIIRDLWQPADLGIDTRRGRVLVPLVLQGRVTVWTIPPQ